MDELIYVIGEALLMELNEVKRIEYEKGEHPTELKLIFEDGQSCSLKLKKE